MNPLNEAIRHLDEAKDFVLDVEPREVIREIDKAITLLNKTMIGAAMKAGDKHIHRVDHIVSETIAVNKGTLGVYDHRLFLCSFEPTFDDLTAEWEVVGGNDETA